MMVATGATQSCECKQQGTKEGGRYGDFTSMDGQNLLITRFVKVDVKLIVCFMVYQLILISVCTNLMSPYLHPSQLTISVSRSVILDWKPHTCA